MTDAQKRLKVARAQFTAVAGAAAAFGAALTAAAIKGAQEIDRVAKSARRLDTSIAGFRAMELAAGEAGVSMSSLTNDVQTMNREIANIGKTGNAQRALDALGLAASDLAGKDADEQLATLADRITDMGLSAGETTAILRDLGVRNREMVLALMGGGDVFRNARKDVEDYGLALDDVDASKIETANDQMARLGLVTQYVGQQLAVALVPALGRMAEAFTDSLREGGLLRTLIDGLADNIDTLVYSVGVAVAAFGTKLVFALVAAKGAVGALIASLVALKGALISTGIGAVIVLAGYLIAKLLDLVKETGGWANALSLLGEVASGVWEGIVTTADAMGFGLASVWQGIKADFFAMVADMTRKWADFIKSIAPVLNVMSLASGNPFANWGAQGDALGDGADTFDEASKRAAASGKALSDIASSMASEGFDKAREALAKLNTTTQKHAVDTDRMYAALLRAKLGLEEVEEAAAGGGGGGGKAGGGAGGAAGAIQGIEPALNTVAQGFDTFKSSVASAFEGLITGATSFKDALAGVLRSLASVFAQAASSALFGGLKLPGFATGTPYAPGGLAMVGERGPELVNLPRGSQVLNANQTRGAMGGGSNITFAPQIDARGADVGAVQRLEQAMMKAQAEFESRAINAFNTGKKRRLIT